MKKIITIILLVFTVLAQTIAQVAERVSQERAFQTAQSFANAKLDAKGETLTLVKADNIYVFDIGNRGFVMVSGSTILPPILGYSLNETFPSLNEAPDNFISWIAHYGEMIDFAFENGILPEKKILQQWDDAQKGQFPTRNTTTVDPLIQTNWNQDYPYNYYAPATSGGWWEGPGGHCYAGCVACAMAQIMKFWNHPTIGNGSHSYVHGTYGEQSANFGETTYNWAIMPNELGYQADNAARAVALLMYHCGVSVNMNFGPDGSGAYSKDVETALRSYFGYCGAKYCEKKQYDHEVWVSMLKSELDLSHPIYYSGNSESVGHAIVCDGYDENDFFHFNLGWSGSGNDYYSLYDVAGYNNNQAAVMNIVPIDIRPNDNGIIYISADGDGNGSSWEHATSHLEYATYLSSGNNIRLWVKKGTYYGDNSDPENAFYIHGKNKIYGSFNGDEPEDFDLSQRDFVNNATILDGQGIKRVLNQDDVLTSGNNALWDGFTIQNGHAGTGGGVYINGFVTLKNCTIRDNVANAIGGGVYINSSDAANQVVFEQCKFIGNSASIGGGICDRNGCVFTNCFISNNIATTKGGGIYIYNNAEPDIKGCVISNNSAAQGGGLYVRGKCRMFNCDIVMNEATETYGGCFNENNRSSYQSCILWGNLAQGVPNQNTGSCSFEYCAVQGGIPGEGNIDLPAENDGEEPGVFIRFKQPAQGVGSSFTEADWDIRSRSICLNSGMPGNANYSTDLAGHQRLQHGRIDIGAYERNASLTLIDASIWSGQTYWFNNFPLHEPGYYTTVYQTSECDSVVGLTLEVLLEIGEQPIDDNPEDILSIDVLSLHGQRLGALHSQNEMESLHLSSGCYLLRIHTREGIRSKKVILP
ncbi:MAG: C10 family peptidase [Bacteroidales bacterium]|nr:C10 family peptidase [Bacteroidales bacterium]